MPMIEWSERLSVGVAEFDADHKQLVALLNELFAAIHAHRGHQILTKIFAGLTAYAGTHFANEEVMMEKYAYPERRAHTAQHHALARQVRDFQARYLADPSAVLIIDVSTFLKDWLIDHILGSDQKYGAYLNGLGVR
jgi:hemerythrin